MIIKCKMCGGDLAYTEGATVCECEYCGSIQTIPNADSEKKTNLFNRANRLRMNNEFDKASAVYESIVAEFPEEAEAYWGLCLCAYGIEYVDDPGTGEKKPTCHRTRTTSIMEDPNFEQACDNADTVAKKVYRDEAKAIDRIQKDILSIVATEKPYDVFICYKETAPDGNRTEDSVLGQDIYDALTAKGLKVFFARITLEDKLGQQYEPYIYAALASSKVMLAIGTQFEYYDAVWVKNEWSRFLSMMKTDRSKMLVPCFKGLDAYDMPNEFKGLQAQDMGKLGWMQDLTRGVLKIVSPEKLYAPQIIQQQNGPTTNVQNLLKRTKAFLRDKDWEKAGEYIERVLDEDVECSEAYLYNLLLKCGCSTVDELKTKPFVFAASSEYKDAYETASPEQKVELDSIRDSCMRMVQMTRLYSCLTQIMKCKERQETDYAVLENRYQQANDLLRSGDTASACFAFNSIADYKDSASKVQQCLAQLNEQREQELFQKAVEDRNRSLSELTNLISSFKSQLSTQTGLIETLTKEIDELKSSIPVLNKKVSDAEQDLAQIHGLFTGGKKREAQAKINAAKEEVNRAQNALKSKENDLGAARSKVTSLEHEITDASGKIDMLRKTDGTIDYIRPEPLTIDQLSSGKTWYPIAVHDTKYYSTYENFANINSGKKYLHCSMCGGKFRTTYTEKTCPYCGGELQEH